MIEYKLRFRLLLEIIRREEGKEPRVGVGGGSLAVSFSTDADATVVPELAEVDHLRDVLNQFKMEIFKETGLTPSRIEDVANQALRELVADVASLQRAMESDKKGVQASVGVVNEINLKR